MPGVIETVRVPNGVAIVAASFVEAKAAREALKVNWNRGAAANFDFDAALENYAKVAVDPKAPVASVEKKGDVGAAFAGAAKTFKADFRADYGYHAQMEPLNAVVRIADDGKSAEVWEGTQAPTSPATKSPRRWGSRRRRSPYTSATWAAASGGVRSAITPPSARPSRGR